MLKYQQITLHPPSSIWNWGRWKDRQDSGGRKETDCQAWRRALERWKICFRDYSCVSPWFTLVWGQECLMAAVLLLGNKHRDILDRHTTAGWKAQRLLGSKPSAEEGYLPAGSEGRSLRVSLSRLCLLQQRNDLTINEKWPCLFLYHIPTSADLRLNRKAVDSPEVPLL